jgi:galactoside O-acetyltransferase
VAAGALVRQDVPAGMVAAGMPATLVRARRLDAFGGSVLSQASGWRSVWRRWLGRR